jgi:hypothetical protein
MGAVTAAVVSALSRLWPTRQQGPNRQHDREHPGEPNGEDGGVPVKIQPCSPTMATPTARESVIPVLPNRASPVPPPGRRTDMGMASTDRHQADRQSVRQEIQIWIHPRSSRSQLLCFHLHRTTTDARANRTRSLTPAVASADRHRRRRIHDIMFLIWPGARVGLQLGAAAAMLAQKEGIALLIGGIAMLGEMVQNHKSQPRDQHRPGQSST